MKLITIAEIARYNGYFTIPYTFIIPIPEKFVGKTNKKEIAQSYSGNYDIITIDNQEWFQVLGSVNLSDNSTLSEIKATLEAAYTISKNKFNLFELTEFDDIMGLSFDGENWF
jgi:hypothetical protein